MDQLNNIKDLDNLSLVIHGPNDLRLEQTPIKDTLEPNECLLETHSCGFCGTDIHLMDHGRMADFIVKEPLVIGHETSARVVAVGGDVKNLKVGDRVAVETAIPCQKCDYCRAGRYNLCPISNTQARGLPPKHGCLRRYYAHPADFLFKLPDNVSWEEGAMCEPFSCIVHACRRLNIMAGHNVLVCGAGAMGMMAFLCAKAFGANKVFVTDINKSRLALADKLGADKTYAIDPKTFNDFDMAQTVVKDMGCNPDISIECTGNDSSTSMAIYATKNGGKVGIVGLGGLKSTVPLVHTAMREIDLIGVCRFKDDYPLAIELIASGKVNLKPLITHKFPITEAIEALKFMKKNVEGSLKIMVHY
ncbi:sorbitol dehydrogenase-like [Oppia nitens]|uniref:sorbitol dehydrogenase-like n=1 Tax=Oppia nitens TaxID=1686743 RepID=UPI0023D9E15C|nr:sorbitol dehydrogenase-like [Oppia nitens]